MAESRRKTNQNSGQKNDQKKDDNKKPSKEELREKDLNNDGKITKADETLRRDKFSMQSLKLDYETAARIIGGDDSLKKLFNKAIKEQWTPEMFQARLQATDWYQSQGTEFARQAWIAKQVGGASWDDQLNAAAEAVRARAATVGAVIPDTDIMELAEDYLFGGWSDPARSSLLDDVLSQRLEMNRGAASEMAQKWRDWAWQNGVTYTDDFYQQAAQSVIAGNRSEQDYLADIQEQAALKFPIYADRIRAGVSVRSLVSPYLTRMSELLEMDANEIELDDPYIKSAVTQVDEQGNPKPMNYGEFEQKIRRDPRWQNTTNGKNQIQSMNSNLLKMWGFVK